MVFRNYTAGTEASKTQFVLRDEEGGAFKSVTFKACEDFRDAGPRENSVFYGLT